MVEEKVIVPSLVTLSVVILRLPPKVTGPVKETLLAATSPVVMPVVLIATAPEPKLAKLVMGVEPPMMPPKVTAPLPELIDKIFPPLIVLENVIPVLSVEAMRVALLNVVVPP